MTSHYPAVAILILALSATAATAEERVARAPSATDQAAASKVSQGQAAIDRAAAAGKYVLLFFWRENDAQTGKAWAVFQPAAAKLADSADIVSIQITNSAEKRIIDTYNVTRAPMPLVLAVAPCGAITKAFTKTFDENQLRTAFVSPCTQRCLKALQSRKLVFVCVVERSAPNVPLQVPTGVEDFKADKKFGPATEIVLVDAQDESEATFLKELGVSAYASKPLTVFLAPPGAMIGKFGGAATKDVLLAKLAAAQSNPCAGGKCGPGGCGPKK
jgi:hypothetical protein